MTYKTITADEDESAMEVIEQVASKLAERFWFAERDDLIQDAMVLCSTTDVYSKASSMGAFNIRLKYDLLNKIKTETNRRSRCISYEESVEQWDEGSGGDQLRLFDNLAVTGFRGGSDVLP